jgi:hypothetical protein
MQTNGSLVIAVIEQAGVPALRVAFTIAVIIFLTLNVVLPSLNRKLSRF